MFSGSICVVNRGQNFIPFSGPNKIPLYGYIGWVYCILFIHLSVDGHLCCFHILATVRSTAVNIHVQKFCLNTCFLLLGAYAQGWHCWIWEATELFSIVAVHCTFLPARYEVPAFPHFPWCCFLFVIIATLVGMEWNLALQPWWLAVLSPFPCAYCQCSVLSLEKGRRESFVRFQMGLFVFCY